VKKEASKRLAPRWLNALCLTAALLGTYTADSQAATVRVVEQSVRGGTLTTPVYSAAPGEHNELTVYMLGGATHFSDSGAIVDPGQRCESLGAGIARCLGPPPLFFPRVEAGDAADSVAMNLDDGFVLAGEGDDEVTGGRGLFGGGGDDLLRTGASQPNLSGGPGNDRLQASSTIPVMHGGPGNDVLRGGPDGGDLNGGEGNDRIYGEGGRDYLNGGPGNDRLVDRSGPGASQFDDYQMRGGSGADSIDSVNGRRERIDCGPGRDAIRADGIDRLKDCERVRRARPRGR